MDEVRDIVKTTNLEELVFYLDYVEMILEIVEKRNLKDPVLELEYVTLKNRYDELLNSK